MIDFIYHVIIDGQPVLSNLPIDLFEEMSNCPAETQCIMCPVRGQIKRHKKLPIKDGFAYLCSYDNQLTKNYFKLCFDVFLSLIGGFAESVKRAIQPSFERVNALRHNVYDQLSHIQDDFKSLLSFEDISLKDWPEIVSFSNNRILSNCEVASKTILRTLKRVAIALSEFDAYELINSTRDADLYPHLVHKVIKLSLQPYIYDLWNNNVRVNLGECYDKVLIDYELINLALGHFWNNAVKYAKPNSDINISFSPSATIKGINVTINMISLAILPSEKDTIFIKGVSGSEAKKAKLDGHGMGMYYIQECVKKSGGLFTVDTGSSSNKSGGKSYASNTFRFSFLRE